jgi:hypothetical protein
VWLEHARERIGTCWTWRCDRRGRFDDGVGLLVGGRCLVLILVHVLLLVRVAGWVVVDQLGVEWGT